ncbi:Mid2 domain [Trypanosoma melophagium]|uniref:Mid2 domain n=1 Tax=Trypanosoma melophagium TaxID=715481 RepID=UPI003519DF8C|nr:Mid2 domain [Trypanosoma melophagium]
MAQYDAKSRSDSVDSNPEPAPRTATNAPQATITPTISNSEEEGSEGQSSTSDNGKDSNSNSGSGNVPPAYVAALNLETSYVTNAKALQAISTNAGIPLAAMAVVDHNNNSIPTIQSSTTTEVTGINGITNITAEEFHPLRVGFTTVTDAAKARNKIIIGCVVGIGVPVIIAIGVVIFCCCRNKNSHDRGVGGYARPEFGDTAIIDLDKEAMARLTPTVPLNQQQDHMMGVVEDVRGG